MSPARRSLGGARIAKLIGDELRRLRLREGLTQDEVAQLLSLPRPVVCRRERGRHVMQVESVATHAAACGGSLAGVLLKLDIASGALARGAGR